MRSEYIGATSILEMAVPVMQNIKRVGESHASYCDSGGCHNKSGEITAVDDHTETAAESRRTRRGIDVLQKRSSAIVQETIQVHEMQNDQGSAAIQLPSAHSGKSEGSPVPDLKSEAAAQQPPSKRFVACEKPQTPIADSVASSKPVKTNKRSFQHADSSAAGKTLTESTKPDEAPIAEEATTAINASKTHVQQGTIRCIINRPDGEETTRLRSRPDGSQKTGVWVKGNVSVGQGEVVEVLRKDSAGETGFAFIRTANNTEGFVRSDYIGATSIREMADTIDCSPAQVVSDQSTIFAHCCQTLQVLPSQNSTLVQDIQPTKNRMGLSKSKHGRTTQYQLMLYV